MRTEQGKRKWVKAYLYVKFAELVAFAVVVVGSGIVTSMYMDPAMFWPALRALLCAAYIWEMIFIFYRVFFLYPGEKLAILWMALAILEVPGWYALFRDLTGIQFFAGGAVDLPLVAAGQADAAAGGILLLCGYQYHQPGGGQQNRSEIMFEGRGIMGRRRLIIVLAAFCAAGCMLTACGGDIGKINGVLLGERGSVAGGRDSGRGKCADLCL